MIHTMSLIVVYKRLPFSSNNNILYRCSSSQKSNFPGIVNYIIFYGQPKHRYVQQLEAAPASESPFGYTCLFTFWRRLIKAQVLLIHAKIVLQRGKMLSDARNVPYNATNVIFDKKNGSGKIFIRNKIITWKYQNIFLSLILFYPCPFLSCPFWVILGSGGQK